MTNLPAATPAVLVQPDAAEERMIAMCAEYLDAVRLYDAGVGPDEGNPLWEQIETLDAALEAWEPRTFAGIVAAAGMVAALASGDPDCCDPWGSSYTGHWPETVARAVLRLGAAEAIHPETRQGGVGRGGYDKGANLASFSADTASRTGRSERDVQRDATRGERIDEDGGRQQKKSPPPGAGWQASQERSA